MHRARNYIRSEIPGASPTIAEHKKDPTGFPDLNIPVVVDLDATLKKQTLVIESVDDPAQGATGMFLRRTCVVADGTRTFTRGDRPPNFNRCVPYPLSG